MRTYRTDQAAELTGVSVRALRKRIERGQLRAVQQGRFWRIPHTELERAGLLLSPQSPQNHGGAKGDKPADQSLLLAELEQVRAENVRLVAELKQLRPLTVQADSLTEQLHQERAERQTAEQRLTALAEGSWRQRRRLLRELRA